MTGNKRLWRVNHLTKTSAITYCLWHVFWFDVFNELHHSVSTEKIKWQAMSSTPQSDLINWMNALEFYARDWDDTFGGRSSYFTQEFWYMLIGCLRASWEGRPMTVSQLTQAMKSGSNRTREERIKRAVSDGYLVKVRGEDDGRAALVHPTEKLEALVVGHLERTLKKTSDLLRENSPI